MAISHLSGRRGGVIVRAVICVAVVVTAAVLAFMLACTVENVEVSGAVTPPACVPGTNCADDPVNCDIPGVGCSQMTRGACMAASGSVVATCVVTPTCTPGTDCADDPVNCDIPGLGCSQMTRGVCTAASGAVVATCVVTPTCTPGTDCADDPVNCDIAGVGCSETTRELCAAASGSILAACPTVPACTPGEDCANDLVSCDAPGFGCSEIARSVCSALSGSILAACPVVPTCTPGTDCPDDPVSCNIPNLGCSQITRGACAAASGAVLAVCPVIPTCTPGVDCADDPVNCNVPNIGCSQTTRGACTAANGAILAACPVVPTCTPGTNCPDDPVNCNIPNIGCSQMTRGVCTAASGAVVATCPTLPPPPDYYCDWGGPWNPVAETGGCWPFSANEMSLVYPGMTMMEHCQRDGVAVYTGANAPASCPSAASYMLSISRSPTAGGTTNVTSRRYVSGTTVEVCATASPGYTFSGWSNASTLTTPCVNILMNADKTLTANFERAVGTVGDYCYWVPWGVLDGGCYANETAAERANCSSDGMPSARSDCSDVIDQVRYCNFGTCVGGVGSECTTIGGCYIITANLTAAHCSNVGGTVTTSCPLASLPPIATENYNYCYWSPWGTEEGRCLLNRDHADRLSCLRNGGVPTSSSTCGGLAGQARYCDFGECVGGSGYDCLTRGGCYRLNNIVTETYCEANGGTVRTSCPFTSLPPAVR